MVLGRAASVIAKRLLDGEEIILLNAERMVISGHLREILAKYKRRIELQDKANPEHSPYWSRRPDLFVKRVIRGMLPYKKARGKTAFKLLRVYAAVPEPLLKEVPEKLELKSFDKVFENTLEIRQIMEKL